MPPCSPGGSGVGDGSVGGVGDFLMDISDIISLFSPFQTFFAFSIFAYSLIIGSVTIKQNIHVGAIFPIYFLKLGYPSIIT